MILVLARSREAPVPASETFADPSQWSTIAGPSLKIASRAAGRQFSAQADRATDEPRHDSLATPGRDHQQPRASPAPCRQIRQARDAISGRRPGTLQW